MSSPCDNAFPLVESFDVVNVGVEVKTVAEVQQAFGHGPQSRYLIFPEGELVVALSRVVPRPVDPSRQLVGLTLDAPQSLSDA